jgi:hypothetical protein
MITIRPHHFISYTVRDGVITEDILKRVKKYYNQFGTTFIDLLDNDSEEKQSRVYYELEKSDVLILIKTPGITDSNWVKKELKRANEQNIPINEIDLTDLNQYL